MIISFNVQLEKLILVEQSLEKKLTTKKEITSQTDRYLVILSSKAYVFEGKLTKYQSV